MPTSAEDRESIRTLIARYCLLLDCARDPDAITDLFSTGGTWEGFGAGPFTGAALRDYMTMAVSDGTAYRHFTFNETIAINGNRAAARSYLVVLVVDAAGPKLLLTGTFEDELVRSQGAWRFASRKVVI